MTRSERAVQIWPILALCAMNRQTLTYDQLSGLIGVPRPGLGQLLEPIQSYCLLKDLPPLTSLVVGAQSGLPGEGFIAAEDVPAAQAEVFGTPWLDYTPPSKLEFEDSVRQLPSNGRSLDILKGDVPKVNKQTD